MAGFLSLLVLRVKLVRVDHSVKPTLMAIGQAESLAER